MNDAVESTFKLIRTASVVRARQFLDPARKADTVRALRAATLVTVESGDVNVTFTRAENVVRVTTGLLRAIDARAAELPPGQARQLHRRRTDADPRSDAGEPLGDQ